jgi:hypothetical protein
MKVNILQFTNIKEGTVVNVIRNKTSLAVELCNKVYDKRKHALLSCYIYCSDKSHPTYVECNIKLTQKENEST